MTAYRNYQPELIQVTYRVLSPTLVDPEKRAKAIALGQTTDTWTPNANSGLAKLKKHTGVVLGVDERPHTEGKPYEYFLTIGFPTANIEDDIPSLLTMIFGKVSLDGLIRVETIELPADFLKQKGPGHGIEGIRKLVGEATKPLAMAIFKPCVGLSPAELGQMFYELALGGMHLVKDDEILPDISLCPAEKRLEAVLKAAEKAKKLTNQTTIYALNLTGRPSGLVSKARALAKLGAPCFLFNVLSYGYGVLEELRGVGVPVMAHPALAGAWCGGADTGFSYATILGTLMRAGGADIVLFPSSYGTVALPSKDTNQIGDALTKPLEKLKRSFPAPSAGIYPGLVPQILADFGNDCIINAGGGVHGHPKGARAGARAFRQAIDWCMTHRSFAGLSEQIFPELAAALRTWGARPSPR